MLSSPMKAYRHPARGISPHDPLDVVRAAVARLAALDVDDSAEGALEWAAPARVERREHAVIAGDQPARQIGDRLFLQTRQVVHRLVDRPGFAAMDVPQAGVEMLLGLPGVKDDPEVDGFLQLGRQLLEHRHAAADVKSSDCDRDALRSELARNDHRAGNLVGLDADEADEALMSRLPDAPHDLLDRDSPLHLVVGVDLDGDAVAKDLPLGAVLRDRIKRRHGVRRNPGLPPLNNVAVLVVVGRLDDLDMEARHGPQFIPPPASAGTGRR